jgi:hypothetical protein
MNSRDSVAAASATYRKATNRVAKKIRVRPKHTRYPSDDFDAVADLIDVKTQKRALQWYKRGIRRGFIEACDALLDGRLELKAGSLYCPSKLVISVRTRFRGSDWKKRVFKFKSGDFDFE